MKNTTKVWLFLILIGFLSLVIGYKLGDRLGLLGGFLFCLAFGSFLLNSNHNRLLRRLKARELLGQDAWGLNHSATRWAHRLGIPSPRVFLMEQETAAAFSFGQMNGGTVLCLSTGLINKLPEDELEVVIVHQICHLFRTNTFAFITSSILADAVLSLAEILDIWWPPRHIRLLSRWKDRRPFRILLSPLAWLLIRINVQDRTYFQNDDLVVQYITDRRLLARVLWKLEALNQAKPLEIPDCSSHLFVVNPRGLKETHWFYTTHPSMRLRMKRLIGSEYF